MTFKPGDRVWYEVSKKDGDDWRIPAVVIEMVGKRVLIQFAHWSDGHTVRRAVRPHRVSPRGQS